MLANIFSNIAQTQTGE